MITKQNLIQRIYWILLFIMIAASLSGQEVEFNIFAPAQVNAGDEFYLKYSINKDVKDINPSTPFHNFIVKNGPFLSTSQSMSFVNGTVIKNYVKTFTYLLIAPDTGTFSFPVAWTKIDSFTYFSDSASIKVELENHDSIRQDTSIDDVFIELSFSKHELYKQEPFTGELKLFSKVEISDVKDFRLPSFDDFLKYDLKTADKLQVNKEMYNGEEYRTVVLHSFLLIPQASGKIQIDKAEVTCNTRLSDEKKKSADLFNTFFPSYIYEEISVVSDSQIIFVNDFPDVVPSDFSNICGKNFKFAVSLNGSEYNLNYPFTFEITLSGYGNLKMTDFPDIVFPQGLTLQKRDYLNNLSYDENGISGEKKFIYTILPEKEGNFVIPSVSISYFNTYSMNYQRILTPSVLLKVTANGGSRIKTKSEKSVLYKKKHIKSNKDALILVLDVSGSMLAKDFEPDRKSAAMYESMRFLKSQNGMVGLILFSEVPVLVNPLTNDKKEIINAFNHFNKMFLGEGTASGFGIGLAVDELKKIKAKNKRIVLITDGSGNCGSVNEKMGVDLAETFGIRIDIIGISGNMDEAPIPIKTSSSEQMTTIPILINDSELKKMANITGGFYFRATDSQSLRNSFTCMDKKKQRKINDSGTNLSPNDAGRILLVMLQDISEIKERIEKEQPEK